MSAQPSFRHVGDLASYVETASTKPLPRAATDAALQCIFDLVIACAVGVKDVGPSAIRRAAPKLYGQGDVPIWFTGEKSSVIGAAWANSSASAALDLDDGNRYARGHPGAAIIPVAFAVGHDVGASFEQIIRAIVVGYEVGVVVGRARTTYGSSGTWTPYGVVATAAVLRRSPRGQVEHAFAIAGESAPNQSFAGGPAPRIPAPEGAAVKEGIPWGVVTGLSALYLAEAGHTGPRNILESRFHYKFPEDLALGRALHICQTYFKPYACCRHVHAPLEALQQLLGQHGIKGEQIDAIEVGIHADGMRISNRPDPKNLIDIQYSIPFCLAITALHGAQTLVPVTAATFDYPGVVELAGKVTLSLDQKLDDVYPKDILAHVTIVCGGRRFFSGPTPPKGEPLMTWQELERKLLVATRIVASGQQQAQLLEAIRNVRNGKPVFLLTCLETLNLTASA